ncbi:hypothetical protein [Mycobacterium sp.]|uniref:hypothetical protein n=1 Tax=Mycobacterium sp. TaxID=1785 RepID=UPI003BB0B980
MNVVTNIIAGALLAGSTVAAAVGLASGPAAVEPLSAWAPNGHNTFATTDDPDPSVPPPPAPPTPFCTPRGGLFIVGPICDEIGVGPPEKHG